jgi:ABC-type antimicrobial peptide transport system permease subunit
MKTSDLLYFLFQSFKNRKSRFFFTILGVAVAIAVVLSMVSFGYGLQKNLLSQITTQESLLSLDVIPSDSNVIKLDPQMIDKLSKMRSVIKISPEASFSGKAVFDGVTSESSINVVAANFFSLDGSSPVSGRFFADKDIDKIVVSGAVVSLFNQTNDGIIGKKLELSVYSPDVKDPTVTLEVPLGHEYEVVGVIEGTEGQPEIFFNKNDFSQAPITDYQEAKIGVSSPNDIESVRTELINMGFVVSSLSDTVDQANKIFTVIQISLGVFGIFALIVAAIGLINTMTISLLERTNEIGIMRAIGGSPADIRRIFLGESIMIGFVGGIAGIILGFFASETLNWLFNILAQALGGKSTRLFSYPLWFIIFIVIVSTLVGLIGGIWPARRAAHMNPLEALRYK